MKKLVVILAILAVAAAAYASTAITVTPSTMKNGETKTLTDGNATVKVTRNGDDVDIRVEGAGGARHITVSRSGDGDIRINRGGHVVINGRDVTDIQVPDIHVPEIRVPRMHQRHMKTMFVCPKDGTTLSVPDGKEDQTYKCPVDGTTLEKKKGKSFSFYFDSDDFEAFESL